MLLQVLGTAAGGGVPQWNCACPGCSGARAHPERRRRHASLAVRTREGRWYLVNATPDIGDQIEAHPALHPGPGPRQTPVAGVVLTDAELDHTLGIARLREADGLEIHATAAGPPGPGRPAAPRRRTGPLHPADLAGAPATARDAGDADAPRGPACAISAVPVSAKRPRYAADAPEDDAWVVALRLYDPATGRSAALRPRRGRLVRRAAPGRRRGRLRHRRRHLLGRGGAAPHRHLLPHRHRHGPSAHRRTRRHRRLLATLPARCLYTHLNNTNPLVDPAAAQHKRLARLGVEVADDEMVIEL